MPVQTHNTGDSGLGPLRNMTTDRGEDRHPIHRDKWKQTPLLKHNSTYTHTWKDTQVTTDPASGIQTRARETRWTYLETLSQTTHPDTQRDSWPALSTLSCSGTQTRTPEGRHYHTETLEGKRMVDSNSPHTDTITHTHAEKETPRQSQGARPQKLSISPVIEILFQQIVI